MKNGQARTLLADKAEYPNACVDKGSGAVWPLGCPITGRRPPGCRDRSREAARCEVRCMPLDDEWTECGMADVAMVW